MEQCYEEFHWISNSCKSITLTLREQTKGEGSLASTVVHQVSQWRGNTLRRIPEEVQGESDVF